MEPDNLSSVPIAASLQRTRFLIGARHAVQFPADAGWEVAFAGRSNAGKSSALNAVAGMRSLARTSRTPGRTREVNFFAVDEARRVVDLPGYGFARVSDAERRRWARTVERYLQERRSLKGLVLVMDVRHPLTAFDERFLQWCHDLRLAVHILLTKADKLSNNRARASLLKTRRQAAVTRGQVTVQLFSARKRQGVPTLQRQLADWLELAV
ncbi:MAG: ribosome biogenesis GTP-binding protein YihA/YsxC [Gammaproteobacteria bacterium]|nr:ribosome biogenesis GTP-binding protein YihA/YsxC [Gammaproteobacteria bacterium]